MEMAGSIIKKKHHKETSKINLTITIKIFEVRWECNRCWYKAFWLTDFRLSFSFIVTLPAHTHTQTQLHTAFHFVPLVLLSPPYSSYFMQWFTTFQSNYCPQIPLSKEKKNQLGTRRTHEDIQGPVSQIINHGRCKGDNWNTPIP